jgi:hypothetical protein
VLRPQLPLEQVAVWHEPPLEQAAQAPPPVPQALVEVPETQLEPFQQPVQHEPLRHWPPGHEVPLVLLVRVQLPPEQLAVWQTPAEQFWQAAPSSPQALVEVPDRQLEPLRQPVQQEPLRHVPPGQAVPFDLSVVPQLPPEQVGVSHDPAVHAEQPPPLSPQALVEVPDEQLEPLRQPVQHEPPAQVPPGHAVPLLLLVSPQLPLVQVAVAQEPPPGQELHDAPLSPQLLVELPEAQLDPVQQPVQHEPL